MPSGYDWFQTQMEHSYNLYSCGKTFNHILSVTGQQRAYSNSPTEMSIRLVAWEGEVIKQAGEETLSKDYVLQGEFEGLGRPTSYKIFNALHASVSKESYIY